MAEVQVGPLGSRKWSNGQTRNGYLDIEYTVHEEVAPPGYEPATDQMITLTSSAKVTHEFQNRRPGFRKEFTLVSPTLPEGQSWVPLAEQVRWTVTYYLPNNTGNTMYDAVLKDRFGSELNLCDSSNLSASHGSAPFAYSKGKIKQLRLTWNIGDLSAGETAILSFDVVTKLNPGGKKVNGVHEGRQEHTSRPGLKILNSGTILKRKDDSGHQDSMSTPSYYVMAGNTYGAIVGFVTFTAGGLLPDRLAWVYGV